MEIHVYDTYVKAKDGHTMHFDVFTAVKDDKKAVEYAKEWLTSIGEGDAQLPAENVVFATVKALQPMSPMRSTRTAISSTRWKDAGNFHLALKERYERREVCR